MFILVDVFIVIVRFTKQAPTRPHISIINIMHKYTNDGKTTGDAAQSRKNLLGRIYSRFA